MKLHINIFVFLFVILFLISPSLISSFVTSTSITTFTQWNFPLQQGILAIIALLVYFLNPELKKQNEILETKNISKKFHFVFYIITPFIFTFLLLFFNSLIFSFLSTLEFFKSSQQISVINPDSFIKWIYCILNFIFAAFFEEIIYRFYFIDELNFLFNKSNKKSLFWIFEIFGLVIFAISHYYMGFLAVINAAFGHIILRICYKKSKSIIPGFFAHFCYNIISLILL